MSIEHSVEVGEDARRCSVRATCPRHREIVVAEWSTFDGERVALWHNEASSMEFIGGWIPTEDDLRDLREQGSTLGLLLATEGASAAAADDGDEKHFRYYFRCTRPSCEYDGIFRGEQLEPLEILTRVKWQMGVAEYTLEDGDVDAFLRRVAGRDTPPDIP